VNKYVRPRNTPTEIHAGRVACCPLASHVKYAPHALLWLEKKSDGRTDGRQTDALRLPPDTAGQRITFPALTDADVTQTTCANSNDDDVAGQRSKVKTTDLFEDSSERVGGGEVKYDVLVSGVSHVETAQLHVAERDVAQT